MSHKSCRSVVILDGPPSQLQHGIVFRMMREIVQDPEEESASIYAQCRHAAEQGVLEAAAFHSCSVCDALTICSWRSDTAHSQAKTHSRGSADIPARDVR